mmetsp:Transcript_7851/g.20767  ORF Transcript_7851/g.20767 Transcript_7851/m.20767 type:complete len:218 (+) Transcript_7851:449-1102(+)
MYAGNLGAQHQPTPTEDRVCERQHFVTVSVHSVEVGAQELAAVLTRVHSARSFEEKSVVRRVVVRAHDIARRRRSERSAKFVLQIHVVTLQSSDSGEAPLGQRVRRVPQFSRRPESDLDFDNRARNVPLVMRAKAAHEVAVHIHGRPRAWCTVRTREQLLVIDSKREALHRRCAKFIAEENVFVPLCNVLYKVRERHKGSVAVALSANMKTHHCLDP